MPNIISFDDWREATYAISAFKQTNALKAVTEKFQIYSQRPTKTSIMNLADSLAAWIIANPGNEAGLLLAAVQDLVFTIQNSPDSDGVINAIANPQNWARGYEFANDPHVFPVLAAPFQDPPLTRAEITRINEAIARARNAAEAARDAMIEIAQLNAWPAQPTAVQDKYAYYFGAFDPPPPVPPNNKTRQEIVRDNYQTLYEVFPEQGANRPRIIDARNTVIGETCYAFTFKGRSGQAGRDGRHRPPVEVWLGRDFFILGRARPNGSGNQADYEADYANTSDATVGTLIHEISHAVIWAADAPQFTGGVWNPGPPVSVNPADDNYGESPNNNIQSSTKALDHDLALNHPAIAIVNADNFGQFAMEVLLLQEQG